jgi:protein SCO1/2
MNDSLHMKNPEPRRRAPRASCVIFGCLVLFLAPALSASSAPAEAQKPVTALPVDVGIDQKLNQQIPLDLEFRDAAGKTVRLKDYFGTKPVILSLVYYDCPMLCTLSLNGLLKSLQHLKFTAGDEFNVLTVSFDPREKPELAAAKKRVYLTLYNRPDGWNGWHFLTGDQESIRRLTSAVGFRYQWDQSSGQFNHATGIMVLTPEGKLSRYFYGIEYPPTDLRLGLVEASAHKIGSPVDAVLLLCCQYDPVKGRYGFLITRVLQLAGVVTVLCLGSLMLVFLRRERRSSERVARPGDDL